MSLRSKASHSCIGPPRNLPKSQLPTNEDVVNYVRLLLGETVNPRAKDLSERIFRPVAVEVTKIWENEGIPAIKCVQRKIAECYKRYQRMNKIRKDLRVSKNPAWKKEERFFKQLFDIAACRCKDLRRCDCPRNDRVPEAEVGFLRDQRGPRKMFLGSVDCQESVRRQIAASRRTTLDQNEGRASPAPSDSRDLESPNEAGPSGLLPATPASAATSHAAGAVADSSDSASIDAADAPGDADWEGGGAEPESRNLETLTNTALAADRFGVSNRAVAAIINAFQVDIGRISPDNPTLVTDPMKVWRERRRVRHASAQDRAERHHETALSGLYFDGRKDLTCVDRASDIAQEEHIAVVAEPGGQYLTHFTPQSAKAIDQVNDLVNIANDHGGNVRVLGCDGAAVNTGRYGGICRLFEVIQEQPVHWCICQIHSNELNLLEVFRQLDGKTTGPNSFTGPIGKTVSGPVHRMAVGNFIPVPGHVPDLPQTLVADLSNDQQLLYQLAAGVQTGAVPEEIAHRKIGPLNHARWLTLAARLLRLYISATSPSAELSGLVRYLLSHYVPMWFHIRANSSCSNGAKNIMRSLELLRTLPHELQDKIKPVIQRNAYWCHPEAVLLAMVADPDPEVRARAVRAIQQCRQQPHAEVRPYVLPTVNFAAAAFTELFEWSTTLLTEPPLMRALSDAALEDIRNVPLEVGNYPVHTVAVERAVKAVTRAASAVVGETQRHGFICSRLRHREQLPAVGSKRSFALAMGSGV